MGQKGSQGVLRAQIVVKRGLIGVKRGLMGSNSGQKGSNRGVKGSNKGLNGSKGPILACTSMYWHIRGRGGEGGGEEI